MQQTVSAAIVPGRISIVLPTYNRLKTLQQVWASYIAQDGVDEIVVVDDAGTDGTAEFIARERANHPRLIYVKNEVRLNLPATRNVGVARSSGEFVVFGEDDLRFGPGYASKLRDCLQRHGGSIAAGRILFPFPGETDAEALERCAGRRVGPDERIDRRRIAFDASSAALEDMEVPYIHAISMVRREVFDSVSYDPGYRGNAFREETDFYLRAGQRGHRIFFCPGALCVHLPREVRSLGGAMSRGIWVYKYWSLRNNHRFLRRHHADLARRGLVDGSRLGLLAAFAAAELAKIPSFYLRRYAPSAYRALARRVAR